MFWLSHHSADELDRCYAVGRFHVCARCLGTYPVLFLGLLLQLRQHAALEHPWDVPVCAALVLPATLDWAFGRFHPHRFTNAWRSFSGALLGLGLARSLFIHLQRPWPTALFAQGIVVTVIAAPVILITYRRIRRR